MPELRDYLLELADDELFTGHRHSEWTAFAPTLEEDVALASIAQDELAHAELLYRLAAAGDEEAVDALAFGRPLALRRNARLVEAPNRDFAFALARQMLYDLADDVRTEMLLEAGDETVRAAAALIRREEAYHLEHGLAWCRRLVAAGGESRRRLEEAFGEVLPAAHALLGSPTLEPLTAAGWLPWGPDRLRHAWGERLVALARRVGLPSLAEIPEGLAVDPGRQGRHGPGLEELLATLTEVAAREPGARW